MALLSPKPPAGPCPLGTLPSPYPLHSLGSMWLYWSSPLSGIFFLASRTLGNHSCIYLLISFEVCACQVLGQALEQNNINSLQSRWSHSEQRQISLDKHTNHCLRTGVSAMKEECGGFENIRPWPSPRPGVKASLRRQCFELRSARGSGGSYLGRTI